MIKILKNSSLHRLFAMIIFLSLGFHFEAVGQLKKAKKTHEEHKWTSDLWYGGGVNLNFSSGNYSSYFTIGISPMVGYKFNSVISAGPRLSIDYTTGKVSDGFATYGYNSVDYGLGVFSRVKFLPNLFAHFEYSQLNETYTTGTVTNNKLDVVRQWRGIGLAGLGYTSNTLWGSELYICYNLLEVASSNRVPIIFRGGITYNF